MTYVVVIEITFCVPNATRTSHSRITLARSFAHSLARCSRPFASFVQRRYPTDPSRCMDFDANNSLGDGRSNKLLLLEAEAAGEDVNGDKAVPLPQTERWENIMRGELRRQEAEGRHAASK